MRNPLYRRLPRELRSELGKYIVIFLLLCASIAMVSGFLVADGSMIKAYNESFTKYNMEDGNFRLKKKMNKAQEQLTNRMGIRVYENFYTEKQLANGSTMRIFRNRREVNLLCLMSGEMPAGRGEIAIDRMYADNNGLQTGDVLTDGEIQWIITGLVALPDYSALFADNNDSMFDAVKFGVGVVTPEEFDRFRDKELTYVYSWKYDTAPADENEENRMAEDLLKDLTGELTLESFVPRYMNQAITFTGEDMGGDRSMMIMLLYIIIAIMAFIFAVMTSNTITGEAAVIGTLRAMGYTRGELVRHYMTMPLLVTLAGALTGNIFGYTLLKDVCADLYYGSYSLPTYVTTWSSEAFVLTTLVPILMMLFINWAILSRTLTLPPLKFLRRDLRRRKQRRMFPLPSALPFFTRFRLRIIMQNLSNYLVLMLGVMFAYLLLMFGMGMPVMLHSFQESVENKMLAEYQYMLSVPLEAMNEEHKFTSLIAMLRFRDAVETENDDAEKFSIYSLQTDGAEGRRVEEILLYGVEEDSRYIHAQLQEGQVLVSEGFAEKYELQPGDRITLYEKYDPDSYTFTVDGFYDYPGALSVFMRREDLNELFDLGDSYFCGYFSDTEITDIDPRYFSSVIDMEDLTKISRQLDVSMGGMMGMVNVFAMLMFMIIVYLLSKIIIEKNGQSISMVKILGYSNGEIGRLYIQSTSIVVVIALIINLPLVYRELGKLYRVFMAARMSGWMPLNLPATLFAKMFCMGLGTYAVVAVLEYRKIRRVPMDEALKNVE